MSLKIASLFAIAAMTFGCGSDNKQTPADAKVQKDSPVTPDAPLTDAGVVIDASCFTNPDPNSNYQIQNACTTALKVYTTHGKPLLQYDDGGLPPLP